MPGTWLIPLGVALLLFQPTIATGQTEPDAAAPDVRVLSNDGVVHEGRLISLTSSEVRVLADGLAVTLPLEEVRRINRATHGARTGFIVGALTGLTATVGSCASSTDPDECWPLAALVFAGGGAAVGAALGAVYDDAHRGSSLLYAAPGQARTVAIPAFVVGAGAGGVLRRHDTHLTVPAVQADVQFPLSRITSLEFEAMHWSWHRIHDIGPIADDAWRTLSISSKVAWQFGSPAFAATLATGAGVQISTLQESVCVRNCDPLPLGRFFASEAVDTSAFAVIGGGVERRLTSRLIAFGDARVVIGKESGLTVFAGIRLPFGSRAIADF